MKLKRLQKGDVVVVSTVLFGLREYTVKKVRGNKAITEFRTFNTKIYPGGAVYEYGRSAHSTTNGYWVKEKRLRG